LVYLKGYTLPPLLVSGDESPDSNYRQRWDRTSALLLIPVKMFSAFRYPPNALCGTLSPLPAAPVLLWVWLATCMNRMLAHNTYFAFLWVFPRCHNISPCQISSKPIYSWLFGFLGEKQEASMFEANDVPWGWFPFFAKLHCCRRGRKRDTIRSD